MLLDKSEILQEEEDVLPMKLGIWDLAWLIGKIEEMWSYLHTRTADETMLASVDIQ